MPSPVAHAHAHVHAHAHAQPPHAHTLQVHAGSCSELRQLQFQTSDYLLAVIPAAFRSTQYQAAPAAAAAAAHQQHAGLFCPGVLHKGGHNQARGRRPTPHTQTPRQLQGWGRHGAARRRPSTTCCTRAMTAARDGARATGTCAVPVGVLLQGSQLLQQEAPGHHLMPEPQQVQQPLQRHRLPAQQQRRQHPPPPPHTRCAALHHRPQGLRQLQRSPAAHAQQGRYQQ